MTTKQKSARPTKRRGGPSLAERRRAARRWRQCELELKGGESAVFEGKPNDRLKKRAPVASKAKGAGRPQPENLSLF